MLGAAAFLHPGLLRAQPLARIGFLTSRAAGADPHLLAAYRGGLGEAGFVEGGNLAIAYRFADNHYDRLPALAAELVAQNVAVIFANGISAPVVKAQTATIPIVFTTGGDPVKLGLVASLDHPGGNATGAITANIGNGVPRLALLTELLGDAASVAFLFNPDSPLSDLAAIEAAARERGRQVLPIGIRDDAGFAAAFAEMDARKCGGIVVGADPFFVSRRDRLVALAAEHRLPAIYFGREFTDSGGLMSYAASLTDVYRQAGLYTGRILHGAAPRDLPVLRPSRFELVLNLKTARALGIAVPAALTGKADEIIR